MDFDDYRNDEPKCSSCPPGKWQNEADRSKCYKCAKGRYQDKPSSHACYTCPIGQYEDRKGSVKCSLCSSWQGRLIKKACPIGKYGSTPGLGSISYQDCQCVPCMDGMTTEGSGASNKKACSVIIDDTCARGKYLHVDKTLGGTFCLFCPAGKYSTSNPGFNRKQIHSCSSCPNGKYQGDTGRTACQKCAAGKISTKIGSQCVKSAAPTQAPTSSPSVRPTFLPTSSPSASPTLLPTGVPTLSPTYGEQYPCLYIVRFVV